MARVALKPGVVLAICSALLFAITTPLAKLLLREGIGAQLLAGLFYLGSGVGLAALQLWRKLRGRRAVDAPLRVADLPRLSLAVLLGGAVAPVLLLLGLARTAASAAALLLNLEGIATMTIAWLVFHENVDRWLVAGAAAIFLGAAMLSWNGRGVAPGAASLLIAAACLAWGIDNNLTRALSNVDPVQIAMIKGLAAGSVNLALALGSGAHLPSPSAAIFAATLGFFGFGVSLVFFVRALNLLGAARTSAYFSTAPFIGAVLAVGLYSEPVTARLLLTGMLMAIGVYIHLRESHVHAHAHEALAHAHRHVHDEHHRHEHGTTDPGGEPHSHWHRHPPLVHSHPHYPDTLHRHKH
jgi:drug/metabolite transporter (DMT)-like permease